MDLLPQVRETIRRFEMFRPGDVVVVGVSGGPDSVALLDLLWRLRGDLQVQLHVAHLNHLLREEAAREAEFVRQLAASYALPVTVETADVPAFAEERRVSVEVAAREERYRFFARVLVAAGASRVALGHQADDQAETVLLNVLRGAGLAGLKGIPPVREPYVRPLIEVRRAAIEAYCACRELKTCLDASNLQTVYLRNRIRHELLPLLERDYNPGAAAALCRLAAIAREEDEYVGAEAAKIYAEIRTAAGEGVALLTRPLAALPRALARRVVRLGHKEAAGVPYELDYLHTEEVLELLSRGAGKELALPHGVRVLRTYETLVFTCGREPETPDFSYPLNLPGVTLVPELSLLVEARLEDPGPDPAALPPSEALLDYDRLNPPLLVRRRRPGDLFHPFGYPAPVKLKNFLIDQKIPRARRGRLPVVADGAGIVWVGGVRVSARVAVTAKTRRCLHLRLVSAVPE